MNSPDLPIDWRLYPQTRTIGIPCPHGYSLLKKAGQMNTPEPVAVVLALHDAVNTQNVERLLALSTPDIEIVGPRGSGRGRELLRDWLGRAGATFEPRRIFVRGGAVAIEQHAAWRAPDSSDVISEVDLASSFTVADGL